MNVDIVANSSEEYMEVRVEDDLVYSGYSSINPSQLCEILEALRHDICFNGKEFDEEITDTFISEVSEEEIKSLL